MFWARKSNENKTKVVVNLDFTFEYLSRYTYSMPTKRQILAILVINAEYLTNINKVDITSDSPNRLISINMFTPFSFDKT